MAVISDEHDSNQNPITVEQIDGISYAFDTADCAMMLKDLAQYTGAILQMNNHSIIKAVRS